MHKKSLSLIIAKSLSVVWRYPYNHWSKIYDEQIDDVSPDAIVQRHGDGF
jgi:hypothetical protein